MRSRLVALGLVFMSLMVFTAFPVDAKGAEFKLKYADVQPEKHVTNISAMWMAQEINKRTKGRVEMSVYPVGYLGLTTSCLIASKRATSTSPGSPQRT